MREAGFIGIEEVTTEGVNLLAAVVEPACAGSPIGTAGRIPG
jgi:hypothetical protein